MYFFIVFYALSGLTPYDLGKYWLDCQGASNVEECVKCKEKAHVFLGIYNFGLTVSELQNIIGIPPTCYSQEVYDDYVFEQLGLYYSLQVDNSTPSTSSGFHDRTLACVSFNFISQSTGSGQIACVDNLYLSKNYGGVYSSTSSFCGHFTVPKLRFDGTNISSGQAADCSAWAGNAAAFVAGLAFIESPNLSLSDVAMIKLFKVTWNLKMKETSCGYGSITDCHSTNCLAIPTNAIWNNGFWDWLEEQFFGCN